MHHDGEEHQRCQDTGDIELSQSFELVYCDIKQRHVVNYSRQRHQKKLRRVAVVDRDAALSQEVVDIGELLRVLRRQLVADVLVVEPDYCQERRKLIHDRKSNQKHENDASIIFSEVVLIIVNICGDQYYSECGTEHHHVPVFEIQDNGCFYLDLQKRLENARHRFHIISEPDYIYQEDCEYGLMR